MGQRIREKRLEKGLSLERLGKRLGVQRAAVSKWELGAVENISQTKIREMAKIFDCSPSWLMGYDPGADIDFTGEDGRTVHIDGINERQEIEKALYLYELYKNAIPPVQEAVEALLKPSKSDP
jgi:transcriptional regulator with XRE-family HTH domain